MDLELLKYYAIKKKKWVFLLGALGFTGYGVYKIYNLPSVVEKKQKLLKLFGALLSVAEMVSDSSEAIGIVSKDLKEFLRSDSNQIPQSLKQVSKIAKSNEFSESLSGITRGLIGGVLRSSIENGKSGSDLSNRVMDKLFSDAGSGFASVVVGSFARNLVMGFYSVHSDDKSNDYVSRWIEVVCEDNCKELIGDCIREFVSTALAVYLEKTMNVNTYDEIFTGLTNPKHEAKVRDMLVSVSNNAVQTLIRTSHHVWSKNSTYSKIDFEDSFNVYEKNQESGWVSKVSSTLAVPGNRKFVLDMTGTVTFETVRSFMEFVLEKTSECVKKKVDVVNQEVVDRGTAAIRYVSGKSPAVTTLCLTLCLNILNSPWILAPC